MAWIMFLVNALQPRSNASIFISICFETLCTVGAFVEIF